MTRASIAAWGRLLAAGGAPAASHAVLARAPAPERLLEPLAGVALVDATSLDALTWPLDVSAVLARVLDATSAVDTTSPDVERARRTQRVTPRTGSDESSTFPTGAGRAAPVDGDRLPRSEDVSVRPARSPWPAAPVPPAVDTLAGPSADPVAAPVAAAWPPLPATVVADGRRQRWRPSLGPEARIGAATRVVLGATDHVLERLLAPDGSAAPTPTAAGNPARPASRHAEPDAARLLGRAVERVGDRARHAAPVSALADLRARARTIDPIEVAPPGRETAARVTEAATSPGGFRGLALRALGTSDETRQRPVRLEAEPRPAPESRLDDLDARVTESLARVLEREARRHGIDVTGARA